MMLRLFIDRGIAWLVVGPPPGTHRTYSDMISEDNHPISVDQPAVLYSPTWGGFWIQIHHAKTCGLWGFEMQLAKVISVSNIPSCGIRTWQKIPFLYGNYFQSSCHIPRYSGSLFCEDWKVISVHKSTHKSRSHTQNKTIASKHCDLNK